MSAVTTDPRQVRDSLARQSFLRLLGAEATVVEPGHVVLELPFRDDLCQQNGFLHAGVRHLGRRLGVRLRRPHPDARRAATS